MKNKSSILLFSLGLFLVAFSFFVTSETALSFLHASLNQGSELNQNVWLADLRSKGMWFGAALCLAGLLRGLFGERLLGYLEGGKGREESSSFDLFLVSSLCLFSQLLITEKSRKSANVGIIADQNDYIVISVFAFYQFQRFPQMLIFPHANPR